MNEPFTPFGARHGWERKNRNYNQYQRNVKRFFH
jgi:hypothetical protein